MQPDKTRDVTLLRLALSLVGLSDRRKGHNNRTEPISQSRGGCDARGILLSEETREWRAAAARSTE